MIKQALEELYILESLLKESGFLLEDFKTAEAAFLSQGIEKDLVKSYFEKFKEIKTKNKIKDSRQKNIDIWAKEDFNSFKEFVDSLYVQQTKKEIRKNIKMTGADKIAENEEWVVYHVKDHKACVSYGAGTKWCITSPSGEEWDSYSRNNNFYFILSKTRQDDDLLYKIAMLVGLNGEVVYFDAEDNEFDSIKGLKVPKFEYEIPELKIVVDGKSYSLSEFENLKSLQVAGDLDLRDTPIKALPDGLKVGGSLFLSDTQIQTLPDGLEVGGSLYLNDTQIKTLPDGLKVGGDLYLPYTQIQTLPDGLKVGGDLDLSGTQIQTLPDGLEVGGDLYLRDTPIKALPDGLEVGGDLDLSGTQIKSLPDGLEVGGTIIGFSGKGKGKRR